MTQWGRPRHPGIRHNQRIRRGGTWSDQDRRLKRHQLRRLRRKKDAPDTWSSQVRHLERSRRGRADRVIAVILAAEAGAGALAAGGRVLAVFAVAVLLAAAWRRIRRGR